MGVLPLATPMLKEQHVKSAYADLRLRHDRGREETIVRSKRVSSENSHSIMIGGLQPSTLG